MVSMFINTYNILITMYSLDSSPAACRQSALVDTDENQTMYTLRLKLLLVDSISSVITFNELSYNI